MKPFVFFVIDFDQIMILTCLAPQIDCLKLSFVKDINEVGEKMTINNRKKFITRSTMKQRASDVSFNKTAEL